VVVKEVVPHIAFECVAVPGNESDIVYEIHPILDEGVEARFERYYCRWPDTCQISSELSGIGELSGESRI